MSSWAESKNKPDASAVKNKTQSMIRLVALFVALLLLRAPAMAQRNLMNDGKPLQKIIADTVSFEWVRNKVIVPVTIKGKVHRFILDTGAPLVVTRELAEALDAKPIREVTLRDQSGKEQEGADIVRTGAFLFGNTQYEGVPALVMEDRNPIFQCFGVEGFIGSNLLRHSAVTFDLPARKVYIRNGPDLLPDARFRSALRLDQQSNPFFKVSIGDAYGWLLFDSGSDKFFEMSLSLVNEWKKKSKGLLQPLRRGYGSSSVGFTGLEAPVEKLKLMASALQAGPYIFDTVSIATTASGESRMGAVLIEKGRVTVDYLRKHFYFEPYATGQQHRDSVWSLSVFPQAQGDVRIGTIWDSTLATTHDVQINDKVLAINGKEVSAYSLCDFVGGTLFRSDTQVSLRIQNAKGDLKEITIYKQ